MLLYLASQSPRRRELLRQVGVNFRVLSIDVDETPLAAESASDLVCRLAAVKAATGKLQLENEGPVLGADTVVSIDDDILGKPKNELDAIAMLKRLSGRSHQVLSAISLCRNDQQETVLSVSEVSFRPISDEEISQYVQSHEPMGKAGAYAIQGLAGLFVTRLDGSYSGVVGLPLEKLFPLLQAFGVPYWQPVKLSACDFESKNS